MTDVLTDESELIQVVIESPLGADTDEGIKINKRYALWCAYDCYTKGEAAYASHLI